MDERNWQVGDRVEWQVEGITYLPGTVLKVYETTFGSSARDTALQIKLDTPRKGRSKTTVRARNCIKG